MLSFFQLVLFVLRARLAHVFAAQIVPAIVARRVASHRRCGREWLLVQATAHLFAKIKQLTFDQLLFGLGFDEAIYEEIVGGDVMSVEGRRAG